jgi:hypothetical protein
MEDLETRVTDYTDDELAAQTHTAAEITDFDTQVRTSRLDQMAAPTASVSANSQKITNLADPTAASQEAATAAYVETTATSIAGIVGGTKIPNSLVDAKGDIVAASADNTPAKLTAGTNDHVLMAASGESTGLKYAQVTDANVATANKDGAAGTASMRTLGTGAAQAAAGNDSRFTATTTTYLPIPIFENPGTGTSATTYTASTFANNVPGYNLTAAAFSIWHSTFIVPANYVSGTVVIRMAVASGTAGDVRLSGSAQKYADGAAITTAMTGGTAQTVTLAANTLKMVDIAIAVTPAAGNLVAVRVFRDGDNAADTNAAIAYLHSLAYVYSARV